MSDAAKTLAPTGPLTDPIASRLGYLLRRASSVMMGNLGASLAQMGLRPVEATILIVVAANPDCSQSDIGRMLGIKRANMVPLIAGLIGKDYVRKARVDGRSQALSLTDAGQAICHQADAVMTAHEERWEELLDEFDLTRLRATLAEIAGQGNADG
ncbi:MarR family winged helix-turn-helix transcriptional regulator [Sphingobium sp.]|uniref:MarR family winged helix-turn-helix transcriptional regulator n=1 Tax=Sphingobium sp. TaxID=1912891 RepID=UPI003BB534CB